VKRCDTVDRVAPRAGEMSHAHVFVPRFVDERQPPQKLIVSGVMEPHVVKEAAVDLVDDLEVAGQEGAEEGHRPLLEGLGQQRMVRVATGPLRDSPGPVPIVLVLIDQEPHQLGDGD
jgi:hypothetical protein